MADTKLSGLSPFTPVLTDLAYGVDDPGGTPVSGRFTLQALMDLFEANMSVDLTSFTITGTTAQFNTALSDGSFQTVLAEGAFVDGDKTKLDGIEASADVTDATNVETAIEGITFSAVSGATGDEVMIIDATDGGLKAVLWENLPGAASGDVTKVGTPADNQVGVWTGDGTIEGTSGLTYTGSVLGFTGGLLFAERADHAATPTAGSAELWVSNDATQKLYFTDDAGTDNEVLLSGGATDVDTYTGVLGLNSGTAVDVNTKALLEARLSDVSDLAEADGDVYTGTHDFGGADDLEIPNSATPTVDTDGQIAIDTTVTDFSHGVMKYYSGEEMAVVAVPIAELTSPTGGHVVAYNATNDEFELVAQSGGGDMSASTYDPASVSEQLVGLTATQTLTNKTLTSPKISHPVTTDADNYTLVAGDQSGIVLMSSGSANTLTIPPNSTVAFPTGTKIEVWSTGAGTTTILGGTGVTLQGNGGSVSAGSCDIQTQYGGATLTKIATDTWMVGGDIDTVA